MERMTNYMAVGIVEGFEEPENEKQYMEAWQHIYDEKLYLNLQGWFGRTMKVLIDDGLIKTK